jgi:hypothetical protein
MIDQSTLRWIQIELKALDDIRASTDIQELSREKWPSWAKSSTKFNRVLAYSHLPDTKLSTLSASTGIVATLLTERIDPKDAPRIYNYNFYLIVETRDGRHFQSSPIVPKDPSHQSSSPSTWFDKLGSPL